MRRPLLAFFLLALTGCGSSTPLLPPSSSPSSVVIDGDAADWQGALAAVDKSPLTLGVRSDADYVYIAAVTSDRATIRQTLLTGMIVWLDAGGGKSKDFGVHFPLGMIGEGQTLDRTVRPSDRRGDDAENGARLREMTRELAIVQGDNRTVFDRDDAPGITSNAALANGTLTLEIKVPLAQTSATPYAVGAQPGSTLGVGVETPQVDREALRAQLGGRGQRGGRGGAGGRAGGGSAQRGGGQRGGQQRGQTADPISVWVRAALNG